MSDRTNEELRDWIDFLIDGNLSPADARRLSDRLLTDEGARRIYFEAMELQADLEWLHADRDGGIAVKSSNGKPRRSDESHSDWLAPALQENCRHGALVGSLSAESAPLAQVRPDARAADTDRGGSRGQAAIIRAVARLSRYTLIASVILVLSVAAVVAGERIYTFVRQVLMPPRTMVADDGGGVVRSSTEERLITGANLHGTRRIGSSTLTGVALANVFVFPLPPLDELERIHSARLEWTYKFKDLQPAFSIDLYGLGYLHSGDFVGRGFWEGSHDTSLRSDYGMDGSSSRHVAKIASGVMTPETRRGRMIVKNDELVRFLRSLYDDGAQEGDLAVFRLNADESTVHLRRATGYAVVHPPAREGKTAPSEFPLLSITAERGIPVDAYSVAGSSVSAQAITAHWASGSTNSKHAAILRGCDFNGVRRVGSSSWPDGALANVFVFTLPDISESEQVDFASLEWTLHDKQGEPRFSVDLYGLGYVAGDNYGGPCFWEGERDNSLSADYGLSSSADGRVVLLARGVMTPNSKPGRVVVENQAFTDFLRSLYANGARGGDLAVFRLNADTSTQGVPRATGYSVVHPPSIAGRTTQADLPVLRVTAR